MKTENKKRLKGTNNYQDTGSNLPFKKAVLSIKLQKGKFQFLKTDPSQ